MSFGHRQSWNFLLVLALILSGISPACKFISGQMDLMEICGASGAKTVLLPAAFSPPGQKKDKTEDRAGKQCAFCFVVGHVKIVQPVLAVFPAPLEAFIRYNVAFIEAVIIDRNSGHVFARGPPMAPAA